MFQEPVIQMSSLDVTSPEKPKTDGSYKITVTTSAAEEKVSVTKENDPYDTFGYVREEIVHICWRLLRYRCSVVDSNHQPID